jgi:hypothetical protein
MATFISSLAARRKKSPSQIVKTTVEILRELAVTVTATAAPSTHLTGAGVGVGALLLVDTPIQVSSSSGEGVLSETEKKICACMNGNSMIIIYGLDLFYDNHI